MTLKPGLWSLKVIGTDTDRSMSFPITLSYPGFKVTVYLKVEYLKKRCVYGQSYY